MRYAAAAALLFACSSSHPPGGAGGAGGDGQPDAEPAIADATPRAPDVGAEAPGQTVAHDAAQDQTESADVAADAATTRDVTTTLDVTTTPDARPEDAAGGTLQLSSTGFLMSGSDLIFPASASYPMDHSPPFEWSGAPPTTKSFALTFVDESNGATKWVLWDIPATLNRLPGDISKAENPPEVPGSSQRGSLGRTGYSGPGVAGPPLHVYQFVLWALDVQKLPNTAGLTTVDLRTKLLPMHALAKSAPLVAKGQLGGP
jgi:Raf kinase inhibitor-like YbhB/YbcL family protein